MEDVAAVVLGASAGGAAAALLLARAGVPTTLVEAGLPRAEGSRSPPFCLGPRGPLAEVLRRAGAEGAIDLRPAPPDRLPGLALALCRALPPAAALGAARLFAYAATASDAELRAWAERPLAALLDAAALPPSAAALLEGIVAQVLALPQEPVSAGEALRAARALALAGGIARPGGGAAAIPAVLLRLAEAHGAAIRAGARPSRILVEGGRARGVELEGGALLRAGAVVSALGAAETLALAGGAPAAMRVPGLHVVVVAGALADCAAASAMACADRVLVDLGRDPGRPPPLGAWGAARALGRRGAEAVIARVSRPRGGPGL